MKSLFAQVEGKYLEYQWFNNGIAITGQTSASFSITSFTNSSNEGNYTLKVSNDFGTIESVTIELKIQ